MGDKLYTIIKALEQRMDTGVLHDLNITRLHMLIGNELVKQSKHLPDDDHLLELIEKAMIRYFNSQISEHEEYVPEKEKVHTPVEPATHPVNEKPSEKQVAPEVTPEKKSQQETPTSLNFKLSIKRNEDDFQTLINQVPVLFSPLPLRKLLSKTVINELHSEDDIESLLIYIEETAFIKTIQLLTDLFENIKDAAITLNQKIRLGLIVYRLFGYTDFKLEYSEESWKISLLNTNADLPDFERFALGFVRGIFVAADDHIFNQLTFNLSRENQNTIITGAYI